MSAASGMYMPFDPAAVATAMVRRRAELMSELAQIDSTAEALRQLAERLGLAPPLPVSTPLSTGIQTGVVRYRHYDDKPEGEPVSSDEPREAVSMEEFKSVCMAILEKHGPLGIPDIHRRFMEARPRYRVKQDAFRRRFERIRGSMHRDGRRYRTGSPPLPKSSAGDRGASDSEGEPARLPVKGVLDHYAVTSGDCGCVFCTEWEKRRYKADRLEALVPGHVVLGQGACGCDGCAVARQARFAFLAVENKRNLLCEASFHAVHSEELRPLASRMMREVQRELHREDLSDNWWAIVGGRRPIGFWLKKAVGFATSGSIPYRLMASGAVT